MSGPVNPGMVPGALRPMRSGDGLVVRVRPHLGRLTQAQAVGVAELAMRHGSGIIDLSARANLQIRGVAETGHPPLIEGLRALGLIDDSIAAETRRNIVVQPFWSEGDATVTVAAALERALAENDARAVGEIRLCRRLRREARAGGNLGRHPDRTPCRPPDRPGRRRPHRRADHAGDCRQARARSCALVSRLRRRAGGKGSHGGASGARRGPAGGVRAIPVPRRRDPDCRARAPRLWAARRLRLWPDRGGNIVCSGQNRADPAYPVADAADRRRGVHARRCGACQRSGKPASQDDRLHRRPGLPAGADRDARACAASERRGSPAETLHVSGCAKGCAHPGAATFTLVGQPGGKVAFIRDGAAAMRHICRAKLATLSPEHLTETTHVPHL